MKLARVLPRHIKNFTSYRYAHNVGTKSVEASQQGTSKTIKERVEAPSSAAVEEGEEIPKKIPFAKRIFLGDFDTDLLTYPEVLDKERHELLHEMLPPIENFFANKVDSRKIDQEAKIPDQTLQGLKELGLFGLQIPQEYGGLGLNATEFARVGEIYGLDGSIAVTLSAHQSIGLKGLLLYGTEEQKKKYLPTLASGEVVAAFCLTEPGSGSDAASIKTRAVLSPDGKTWNLTGSKIWISNGGIADFFTVFATTADDTVDVKNSKRITAFAVERRFGGITNGKPEDKLGIRGSNTCEVHFDNTPVPMENVIGEVGGGFKVAVNILNSGRFSMGSVSAGAMKKMLSLMTDHVINRKQFGKPLKDFGLIQEKMARLAIDTYVMESLSYMTAGLLDSGLYEDCAVEAAIVKVISSELAWRGISEILQTFGGMGYMKDQPFELALRDSRISLIFEGTNEILRLFIALMGVQYAGKELKEVVKKIRNPFMHPQAAMHKALERFYHSRDSPKLTLGLNYYLHPSLKDSADTLEYAVLRLGYATEMALSRNGSNIVNAQRELKRLADIAIDIYAMTSVLSRASRSYCIGLRNAHHEVLLAQIFCKEARERIEKNVENLILGIYESDDKSFEEIANLIVENRGYFCAHPLDRNFW